MTKNGRTAGPDTADYELSTILDLTNRSGTAEIADLKNIEFSEATLALELGLCRIKKLEFCDNSGKNVEILTLRGNLIEKIENLGRFGDSLRRLDLYGNEITDFGGLAELRGLRSLDLSFNHLRTLENLKIPSEGLLELFLIENKLKNGAKPSKMAENAENCDEMSENSDKMSENGGKMAENDGKMAENDGKTAENGENDLKNTENDLKNTENGLKNPKNGPKTSENASENAFFAQFPSLELIEMGSNRLRKSPDFNSKLCPNLAEIYLGRNKLTEFPDFGELKNLRILALQSNRLTKIGKMPENLEQLYLSHNGISEISNLENLKKLEILDLGNNKIAHFSLKIGENMDENGEKMAENDKKMAENDEKTSENGSKTDKNASKWQNSIEEIWISSNLIAEWSEIDNFGTDFFPKLECVYLEHNPIQENEPRYRAKIMDKLPHIRQIDAEPVRRY